MKGVELPINVLVIIAIAVLVMLGLVALYLAAQSSIVPTVSISTQQAACQELLNKGCDTFLPSSIIMNVDVNNDGKKDMSDNLQAYCENILGIAKDDIAACKKKCQCPGY